jgi:hypothetical protein
VNRDDWALNRREWDADGGAVITGTHDTYAPNGRRPYHSINYVTVHDGFTMYDLLSYERKQNGCSPSRVDPKLLASLGVDPETIKKATVPGTKYTYVVVRYPKQTQGQGGGEGGGEGGV